MQDRDDVYLNYFKRLGFTELTEVQSKIQKVPRDKNILILSPTGSGKTEAVHSRLLEWGDKSIFVQPMRTLATTIYERLNNYHDILGLGEWSIQHSSIEGDKFLSNKYCVTTIDQVLTGYLGLGRQSFIRGKNVLLSNLVFDEVQLFDPDKTLLTTINMLDSLNKFVIMTATMPKYLIDFLANRFDMEVIICEEDTNKGNVLLKYNNKIDFNSIKEKQIVICNTQKQQEYIYNNIEDKDRCIILNSKLLPTDRTNIEREVQKYFGKQSMDNDKILITTQVVEAGMDISADYVYSVIAPIDNLIQRAGRCARWGGNGQFTVFELYDEIYNADIIANTRKEIIQHNEQEFTWQLQKQLVDKILNPFYEQYINKKGLLKNKNSMRDGLRQRLVRDIHNVNIIVGEPQIDSFYNEPVSIHIDLLYKLSKSNNMYMLNKNNINKVEFKDIDVGDTVLIEGNNCTYDELGFRYSNKKCGNFTYKTKINNNSYKDYIKERWIDHANLVKQISKDKIIKNAYDKDMVNNVEYISTILGLHDLGKLDELWQGEQWANAKDEPLAHFPFRYGNGVIFKDRNHAVISAYILQDYCDNVLFNVLLQHHGRKISGGSGNFIKIRNYSLINRYNEQLSEYGFDKQIRNSGSNIFISYRDIITPAHKDWNKFLYLVGTLMESDIESINKVIKSV